MCGLLSLSRPAVLAQSGTDRTQARTATASVTSDSLRPDDDAPRVRAHFSTDSILLGDRFQLSVEVDKDMMQVVEFPAFDNGRLADSIEIVSEGPVDTLAQEGRRLKLKRTYELTCFEPAVYRMGRFPVLYIDKNLVDTLWSEDSLQVTVQTIEIDTTTQQIYDIKPPIKTPLRFGEISGYLLRILLGLIVLGALAYVLIRRLQRKPLLGGTPAPEDPPHVAAIKSLEKLHAQKLWQSGKQKQYYTRLTDILRAYMQRRYGFRAMEYTSAEILTKLRNEALPDRARTRIESLLPLSDFVKFAKYVPDAQQNEDAYRDAYYFVEETKASEQEQAVGSDTVEGPAGVGGTSVASAAGQATGSPAVGKDSGSQTPGKAAGSLTSGKVAGASATGPRSEPSGGGKNPTTEGKEERS